MNYGDECLLRLNPSRLPNQVLPAVEIAQVSVMVDLTMNILPPGDLCLGGDELLPVAEAIVILSLSS